MKTFIKKNKKVLIPTAGVLAAAIVGGGIYYAVGVSNLHNSSENKTKTTSTQTTTNTTTRGDSSNTSNNTNVKPTKVETDGVKISSPAAGATVQPGTEISGTVTSNEGGDLYYIVKGANTGVLVDTKVMSVSAGSIDLPYIIKVSFDNLPKQSDSAVVEVYLMNGNTKLGYADLGVSI
jgi:cytoskeletal protein RodZ